MPDLATILASITLVTLLGAGLAFYLRRSTIQDSQRILRETNADLLQRLKVVEELGEACKQDNTKLRKDLAELQLRYDHLHDVVTNKEGLEELKSLFVTHHETVLAELDTIRGEAHRADTAAKKARAPSGRGYATTRKTKR